MKEVWFIFSNCAIRAKDISAVVDGKGEVLIYLQGNNVPFQVSGISYEAIKEQLTS